MPAGEIILVAFGEENVILSVNPQITFFKIVYRRYTNFSIETIQTNFLYEAKFGKRYTVEIAKIGDLLNKMWLVIELPEIPVVYDYNNKINEKIKFKWTKKIAYAMINFVEIEIGGQIINRLWGEWLNVLDELNWNNFNGSLDEYIGNTPDLTTYQYLNKNFESKVLYIPLFFWFCNSSGASLPLLCLEYGTVRFNIEFNNFENCGIFSPSNYIIIDKYYGNGILSEPLIQYSNQGIAWAEFDSIDVAEYDPITMDITKYYLYYRKISDNEFITTSNFYSDINGILSNLQSNKNSGLYNFIIFGLYSGSIYIPIKSNPNNPESIYIQQTYNFIQPNSLVFKKMFLLCNYIYLDREERKNFYANKHQYVIEQVYWSNPQYLTNLGNRIFMEIINPCKYFVFMGQVKYFSNSNVNYNFNYNMYFFDNKLLSNLFKNSNILFNNKSVIKNVYFSLNSNPAIDNFDMKFYSNLNPFLYFPMAKNNSNFGISTFALYPNSLQPSGSANMSYFSSFEINLTFFPIDVNYNKYIFNFYKVNYNFLKIANGVAAPIFNSAY
jgi:hypothetical protein